MDYMNMDDRSIGMFWVVSYTMAQPACETVINWLSSAGMAELPGLQPNDRVMMTQEVTPLPMSLLSGFSMNLCLKLALQMEEALFVSQVCFLCLTKILYMLIDTLIYEEHLLWSFLLSDLFSPRFSKTTLAFYLFKNVNSRF